MCLRYEARRVNTVAGIDASGKHGSYKIDYKDRQVTDDRALVCKYGKVERLFRIADVSNGDFEDVSTVSRCYQALLTF